MMAFKGKPKAIVFDWDNTLADNRETTVDALNETLAFYGKENWEITKKKYRDPDKSLKENFANFFGALEKEAYKFYLESYITHLNRGDSIKTFPRVRETLEKLDSEGIKIVIVSNKERSLLLMEIAVLFQNINFYRIMANGDSPKNKPDASPVFVALENSGIEINPANVWIVGDSSQDIDCAYNAGCQPILFGSGNLKEKEYFEEKRRSNPPMLSIGNFSEILELFGYDAADGVH
jgi:phosphoglycolate phosphatase